jgi:hypothetical protein
MLIALVLVLFSGLNLRRHLRSSAVYKIPSGLLRAHAPTAAHNRSTAFRVFEPRAQACGLSLLPFRRPSRIFRYLP